MLNGLIVKPCTPNWVCSVYNLSCEFEDDNVIGIIKGIANVDECKQKCIDNFGVSQVFSYYGPVGFPSEMNVAY